MDVPDIDLNDILGVDDPAEFFEGGGEPEKFGSREEAEKFVEALEELQKHVLTDLQGARQMVQSNLMTMPSDEDVRSAAMGVLNRLTISEVAVKLLASFAVSWAEENYPEGGDDG